MLRLGLCCTFLDVPIKFRHTTAAYVSRLPVSERRAFVAKIAGDNARALIEAVGWCARHGIGAFRVQNAIVPLVTHPEHGFHLDELPSTVLDRLALAGGEARRRGIRLSFHPDPFVALSSVRPDVVRNSTAELDHLGRLGALLGVEQMTIHGGSAAEGKPAARDRLLAAIDGLTDPARERLVLENDDRTWTVEDLLPVIGASGLPLVYDVHHHRCNPDDLAEADAFAIAAATWGDREPWCHLSSPAEGWGGPKPLRHADFIDLHDVPPFFRDRPLTVDIEAKAKEQAVLRLRGQLLERGWAVWGEGRVAERAGA